MIRLNIQPDAAEEARRRSRVILRVAAWSLLLIGIGAVGFMLLPNRSPQEQLTLKPHVDSENVTVTPDVTPVRPAPKGHGSDPLAPRPNRSFSEPTPATRLLVNNLVNLDLSGGVMTEEQVAFWKQSLKMLTDQGPSAVGAIREFLAKNADLDFGLAGQQALGYTSARTALFDALSQIGGPTAIDALSEVLSNTADPREIGMLAQKLEKIDPGLHGSEALVAARQSLDMAQTGNLPNRDVAPLFETLLKYGGAGAVGDFERTAQQWSYYAMIGLVQLPDGAGIPSLARFASDETTTSGARVAALQMLAQAASQSEEARNILLEQARQGKLTAYNWATMVPLLAGSQMVFQNSAYGNGLGNVDPSDFRKAYISAGNQSFITAPLGALSTEQINQQLGLIDQFLAVTTDPAGIQALQQAKDLLSRRAPQVAGKDG